MMHGQEVRVGKARQHDGQDDMFTAITYTTEQDSAA